MAVTAIAPQRQQPGEVMMRSNTATLLCLGICAAMIVAVDATAQTTDTITLRGHTQTLRLYGQRGGHPVIVSSGDGGWIHLGPQVAEVLAAKGYFVVGFDVKAYLESFTSGQSSLQPDDEPGDYKVLADYAARGAAERPILIGASEGAGLSLLAATDPRTRSAIAGVIGLGLPNLNELGWRWRDSLIYVTHGVPKEPTFRAAAIIDRVSPAPIAAIHSTHDEFVPLAEVQRVLDAAKEPKRLWIVKASDHRFSDNRPEFEQRLLEAIAWVQANSAL
jgi:dienelactone hydrolase